eukprot:1159803-Pelagomonas_calceolata.AAC.8
MDMNALFGVTPMESQFSSKSLFVSASSKIGGFHALKAECQYSALAGPLQCNPGSAWCNTEKCMLKFITGAIYRTQVYVNEPEKTQLPASSQPSLGGKLAVHDVVVAGMAKKPK